MACCLDGLMLERLLLGLLCVRTANDRYSKTIAVLEAIHAHAHAQVVLGIGRFVFWGTCCHGVSCADGETCSREGVVGVGS